MISFTVKHATAFTRSSTTWREGSVWTQFSGESHLSQSTGIPSSSGTSGVTEGLTSAQAENGTIFTQEVSIFAPTETTEATTRRETLSITRSNAFGFDGVTTTDSYSYHMASGITHARSMTGGDSSAATQSNTQSSQSYTNLIVDNGTTFLDTSLSEASTTTSNSSSTRTRTVSTTSTYTTAAAGGPDSSVTTTTSDGFTSAFTTWSSSTTFSTTVTSTTDTVSSSSSTWGTSYTGISSQTVTTTSASGFMGWTENRTSTSTISTQTVTTWLFSHAALDTYLMMTADLGDSNNRKPFVWSALTSKVPTTTSTAALFTDFFSSGSGSIITLPHHTVYLSTSHVVTAVSISTGTTTSFSTFTTTTDTAQPPGASTATVTVTSSNGSSYNSTNSTTSWDSSVDLGEVGSSLSTYTSSTAAGQPVATLSSTIFTHSVFLSTYASGTSWEQNATTQIWPERTIATGTRVRPYSSVTTTSAMFSRGITTDSVLRSSFTVLGTGTDTTAILLGSVSTSSLRVFTTTARRTLPTWPANLNSNVWSMSSSEVNAALDFTRNATTEESISLTLWTQRGGKIAFRDGVYSDNLPDLNQAWFECQPRGYCGYGGSFSVSALDAYLTTTQGVLSGSTFSEETLVISSTASACDGLTFFPIPERFTIGGTSRAVSTSLVSRPSSMETALSIAATWSSTTSTTQTSTTATTSTVTTRAATHTLAVTSSITGTFYSSDAITINSTARTEMGVGVLGGFGVGHNNRGTSWRAFVRQGCARWTEFSSGQSTATVTHSSTGTNGTLEFTVPYSHAAVISVEPVLTARWEATGISSAIASAAHQPVL